MNFEEFETIDQPVFLQLKHPATLELLFEPRLNADGTPRLDEEGKPESDPVGVMLFGQDSAPFVKRKRMLLDKRFEKVSSGKKVQIKADEVDEEAIDTIAACIHSFVCVDFEGAALANVRGRYPAFLKKHAWAKEQIDEAIVDRSRFLKASQVR